MPDPVSETANRLLEFSLEPVPRYRIQRDILNLPDHHPDVIGAYDKAMRSRMVLELCQSQQADGSWGRFYTRNKQVRSAGKTTETALIRAIALGMDKRSPAIQRLITYMEGVLTGKTLWPDRPDKTLEWPVGMSLVTASRLSQIDPDNARAVNAADQWKKIVETSFQSGDFVIERFREIYESTYACQLTMGPAMAFSAYGLLLVQGRLPYDIEKHFIRHVISNSRGIYLVNNRSMHYLPLEFPSRESLRYIAALELLAGFPSAGDLLIKAVEWLQEQANDEGFWDLGSISRDGLSLPLSDNWRDSRCRIIDCSIRILHLLARLQRSCEIRQTICHNQ
jgi:hypothetical protein